jgi:hypothetical protein
MGPLGAGRKGEMDRMEKIRDEQGNLEPKALRVIELYSEGKSVMEIRNLLHASLPYISAVLKETGFDKKQNAAKHNQIPFYQFRDKRAPK